MSKDAYQWVTVHPLKVKALVQQFVEERTPPCDDGLLCATFMRLVQEEVRPDGRKRFVRTTKLPSKVIDDLVAAGFPQFCRSFGEYCGLKSQFEELEASMMSCAKELCLAASRMGIAVCPSSLDDHQDDFPLHFGNEVYLPFDRFADVMNLHYAIQDGHYRARRKVGSPDVSVSHRVQSSREHRRSIEKRGRSERV